MKISHVFVDMDGVLCNFIKAAYEVHGQVYVEEFYPQGEWDLHKPLNISRSEFWSKIFEAGHTFWENMESFDWTDGLIDMLTDFGIPWSISTSPSLDPESAYGKIKWLHKKFNKKFRNYMIGHDKYHLAKSNIEGVTVLIDDKDSNCEKFVDAQGYSILFPQPWNSNDYHMHDRLGYVESMLTTLTTM